MSVLAHINALSLGYSDSPLFSGLTFDIQKGMILAVVGANGTGKSTFVKTVLGLHKPIAGRVDWSNGQPAEIGYLAQLSEFDRRFPIRVRDLAFMGTWKGLNLFSGMNADTRDKVDHALEQAGVLDLAERPLHTLSGGQLQRALFASVITQDAPLIILDEPFAAVDQNTEQHLLRIIDRWKKEHRAVLLVVHDLSAVLDHCSHALLLGNGAANFGPVLDVLCHDRLVEQGYMSESQASWVFRKSREEGSAYG